MADSTGAPAAIAVSAAADAPTLTRLPSRLTLDGMARPRLPGAHPATPAAMRRTAPRRLGWLAQQRLVGGAVAILVVVASVVGVSPIRTSAGGTGNVAGAGSAPRIAVGGGSGGSDGGFGGLDSTGLDGTGFDSSGSSRADGGFGGLNGSGDITGLSNVESGAVPAGGVPQQDTPAASDSVMSAFAQSVTGLTSSDPGVASQDIEAFSDTPASMPDGITPLPNSLPTISTDSTNQGAFLADGTILKPIAVDTSIPDARTLLTNYKVRKGDTLTSIAHHFNISMVTLYWANHLTTNLTSKTDLKVGQVLSVPPVNGVLHIVTDRETLTDISKRTGVATSRIVATNGLEQPMVYVGQWIIVPGAKAKPIPEPAPVVKPVARPSTTSSSSTSSSNSSSTSTSSPTPKPVVRPTYTGGGWAWPTPGGHISQYFHYGHWAIDIANDYGAPVVAAKAGVVIFAGWKNNGGGWQVWMSHGNGVYTTYNHMSALTVGVGQSISAGHQVGRIGQSGDATGPHVHFEVWLGPIWAGGTRVNPLNYV